MSSMSPPRDANPARGERPEGAAGTHAGNDDHAIAPPGTPGECMDLGRAASKFGGSPRMSRRVRVVHVLRNTCAPGNAPYP